MSSAKDQKHEKDGTTPAAPSAPKGPLLLALVNLLMVLAAAGMMAYTRLIFKRPVITEASERARLEKIKAIPKPPPVPAYLGFDSLTINLAPLPQGRNQYLTVAFTLEIRDAERKDDVEALKPAIIDKFLSLAGRKEFNQINHPQGRIILRNQMIDAANQIIQTPPGSPLVSNILFTQFIVQ